MSTQKNKRTALRQVRDETPLIPLKYQHLTAVLVVILSLLVYFGPVVFGGKTFLPPDSIASHSWDTVIQDAKNEGVFPLWNPYIFCGMPNYGSLTYGGDRFFDLSAVAFNKVTTVAHYLLGGQSVAWVIFHYVLFALGMYLFTYAKVQSKIAAVIGSLGATYSMYIIIWIMSGHNTKISVMALFPFIFYTLERLREKFDIRLALLLVLLIHFSFQPSHIQMIFYCFLAYGIYLLFFLVREIVIKGDWKAVVRTGAVLLVSATLAFAMDSDKYLSVWEYNPFSIRGSAPAVPSVQKGEVKTQAGGLDYDYATSWSLGVGEVMTFIVPSWYGFGAYNYTGPEFGKGVRLNTYFGPQPFTDGPQYMGVVILLLAIAGFWKNRKEPFVQYLAVVILFSMLVAFGKEFSLVYDLMFKYVPTFNKYRIPSMILVLVQIFVPVLAAYGVASWLRDRGETLPADAEKKWKIGLGVLAAVMIVGLIGATVVKDVYGSFIGEREAMQRLARSYGDNAQVTTVMFKIVADRVATEVWSGAALLLAAFGAAYLYLRRKMGIALFAAILVGLVLADLWHVNRNAFEAKPNTQRTEIFTAPDYVSFLKQDTTLFRTLTFIDGQPPYDNTLAYWRIQNAYGYQGAKLRAYQDMVEVAGIGNPLVWQLMNVKYIMMNGVDSSGMVIPVYRGQQVVHQTRGQLPRAFFVNRYETAAGLAILEKIKTMSFNPTDVAYVTDDPKLSIEPPQAGASVHYVRTGVQDLELKVNATGNNLLFLSEAFYPVGWKAAIDGNEIPIYRLNYLFRGVVVPKGEHTLTMKFEPPGFYLGKNLSLGANIFVLGALAFFGLDWWRKRKFQILTPKP